MKFKIGKITAVLLSLIMLISILSADISAQTEKTVTVHSLQLYYGSVIAAVEAGDINGDGDVNNKDLTRLFQYLSEWDVEVNEAVIDVNGDGDVNNKDLTRLFQFLSEWDVEIFPKPIECSHEGDTEIRGAYNASCTEPGYTGDTYCLNCGMKISEGTYIDAVGHKGGIATCHTKAICTVCNNEYGEFDPDNHDGGTEIRGSTQPTCTTPGSEGDTYCLGCGTMLIHGKTYDAAGHTGGTATYYQKATCDVCEEEYGEYTQIYAYDSLNDNQKSMYNTIDAAINRLENKNVYLTNYADNDVTGESDINVAIRALSYDKPEYFWMPRSYSVGKVTNLNTGELIEIYVSFGGQYNVTKAEKEQMQAGLETKVNEIVELASAYETDFEKEVFIHDYLCEHIVYDTASAESESPDFRAFTAYGALLLDTCVCEGYSRAMQLICQRLGIPCNLITGLYKRFDDDENDFVYTPHMWNIINPGDGCYYLDVTFNDVGYEIFPLRHTCFNITQAEMEIDHIFDDPFVSNSDYSDPNFEYNFFNTHGDNYSLGYYTKTGAYILFVDDEDDYHTAASAAANYLAEVKQKGFEFVDLLFDYTYYEEYFDTYYETSYEKYMLTEENPQEAAAREATQLVAAEAIKLLNRKLREVGMNTISGYAILDNYLYVPVP